jgi:benzoyl-CoA reductase/2-hydroxyglutaryl-CoA dehydratase subunit BcrC/BadD/HgdB
MNDSPAQITLQEWDQRYEQLVAAGLQEPSYGGPLGRHVEDGDFRLRQLRFDNSPAALRLWNFLLSEEDRLYKSRDEGKKIIGTMKDLGTVPVMAYSLPNTVAFYPDGAWWVPCIMEMSTCDLELADGCGIDESFCPVRAMLGAFLSGEHFPSPDLLICSVGATCDDFSAISQRLNSLGYPVFWWEIPARRKADADEEAVSLPGGFESPRSQVGFVEAELSRVRQALETAAGASLTDEMLDQGITVANRVRRLLGELRRLVFTADTCPLPGLELLIAEMLALHYCSDREQTLHVYEDLLCEVRRRIEAKQGIGRPDAARIFWVNPVADLRAMNLLEECNARLCGTEFLFCHALDQIPEDLPPMEALAMMALADPMVGSSRDRGQRICRDARTFAAEAVVISRIPGASHCALETAVFREMIDAELHLPVLEIEVPPVSDAMRPGLRNRLEALVEIVRQRRER